MTLDFGRHPALEKSLAAVGPLASLAFILTISALLPFTACSSLNAGSSASTNSIPVQIAISPATATLNPGKTQQFSVTIENTSNTGVTWLAASGSVTPSGLFTAPTVKSTTQIVLTAISNADATKRASATVTVAVAVSAELTIQSTVLPGATEGVPFSAALAASGGSTPYRWTLTSGTLPSGFQLGADGSIKGITSQTGIFPFTTAVTDDVGHSLSRKFNLSVAASSTGSFDGPAELPRVYMQTSMADTPAPGATINVPAGADLQSAINSAKCGDTLLLKAGATFTGTFDLPAKNCDNAHWVVIRTSAPDSALPPEGTRMTPCYAGVSSLPGRPAYPCSAPKHVLATLELATTGSGPIVLDNGASYYRLLGLEITRSVPGQVVYDLIVHQPDGTSDHIVLDRMWIHGTAQDETTRGVMTTGSTYFAVVDSYLSDFHCTALVGACGDSQDVGGGVGNMPMGPIKIVDNFLEAAGENILLGGGPATVAPTDIEVRNNHMFKPMTWMTGSAGFVGGKGGHPFIVKNLFELKNAQRVLLEGNLMEDAWGGFTQVGFAILLTPKNQASTSGSVCPLCLVTDVTIRYNLVRHTGAGMQIGNGVSSTGGVAQDGERYSIHDVIFDDIDGTVYDGPGFLAQVSTGQGAPVLQNVSLNHLTAFAPHGVFAFGDPILVNRPMNNFTFTNSIMNAGMYPFESTAGLTDCAHHAAPLTVLASCFSSYMFRNNAIFTLPKSTPPPTWPSGNSFPASVSDIQFVNYAGGNGGDYHLLPSSPYRNAGTDGKNLGADVDAVLAATAGVQ